MHCRNCERGFIRKARAQRHCDDCSKWRLWKSRQVGRSRVGACARCGVRFETRNSVQRYCSRDCKRRGVKEREAARLRMRTTEKRALNPLPEKICERCQAPFVPYYGALDSQRFCSSKCQRALAHSRKRKKKRERERLAKVPLLPRRCVVCLGTYEPVIENQQYCTPDCRIKERGVRSREKYKQAWKVLQQLKEKYDVTV